MDRQGDAVVIEIKRDKTPRDTLAQLLEYVSFVETLSYQDLQDIFAQHSGEEGSTLADQHRYHFKLGEGEAVAFNKNQKLVIVAQDITREIAQTATFLRKKGLDVLCLAFKYFKTQSGERVLVTDFVVGPEIRGPGKVISVSLPKTNKDAFLSKLAPANRPFFERLLQFAKNNQLKVEWGSKGFTLRVSMAEPVTVLYAYPPGSFNDPESIYTACAEILKNVAEPEPIVKLYQTELEGIDGFVHTGGGLELKYVFAKEMTESEEKRFFDVLASVANRVKTSGLNE